MCLTFGKTAVFHSSCIINILSLPPQKPTGLPASLPPGQNFKKMSSNSSSPNQCPTVLWLASLASSAEHLQVFTGHSQIFGETLSLLLGPGIRRKGSRGVYRVMIWPLLSHLKSKTRQDCTISKQLSHISETNLYLQEYKYIRH